MVYSFAKSSTEQVRAELTERRGRRYANVRVYYQAEDGNWRPTKKGLTIDVDLLPELANAVAALQRTNSNRRIKRKGDWGVG